MTQNQKVIKAKLGLLELGRQLGNISQACRLLGYSRQTYYDYQELVEKGGEAALTEVSRRKPNVANRFPPDVEDAIVAKTMDHPTWGQKRVADQLFIDTGIKVSAGGVRCVWLRRNLGRMEDRLRALEALAAQDGTVLTEEQKDALEQALEEKKAHGQFESEHPGYCGAQDTFYVGTLKGVGRIYQQTFIDTYSKVGFAKLYQSKTALTAADMLNDRVVPFFDEHRIPLVRVLTDRGTEYCGTPEHEYELYLSVEDIAHTRTKAYSPQTNGICERFHKTILDEFYRVTFRRKRYDTVAALQEDLDAWMDEYNMRRAHQGRWCFGKTPMATFLDSLQLARDKMLGEAATIADAPAETQV
jgi:transposase InsO family protein